MAYGCQTPSAQRRSDQFINSEKVLKVLQMLKTSGHPYYQFCEDLNLHKGCKEQDAQGYELLFETDQAVSDGEMKDKNSGGVDRVKNDLVLKNTAMRNTRLLCFTDFKF